LRPLAQLVKELQDEMFIEHMFVGLPQLEVLQLRKLRKVVWKEDDNDV
jgi:hypothetical protein